MIKAVLREIKSSLGRYIAILAIIALGTGFLSGLVITRPAMIKTLDKYVEDTAFYDFRLVSTVGWDDESLEIFKRLDYASAVEGEIEKDVLFTVHASDGSMPAGAFSDGEEVVFSVHTLTENVNRVDLTAGRLPERDDECVADWLSFGESDIGSSVRVSDNNDDDTLDMFKSREYTIVGIATSPSYINFERGNTSVGTGHISGYIYVPESGLDADYYTSVYIKLRETAGVYTDEYDELIGKYEDGLTALAEDEAQQRLVRARAEAQQKLDDAKRDYDEGYAEYQDGLSDYNTERADAEQKLADAYEELMDGERKLRDGWDEYYTALGELDGKLADARSEVAENEKKLQDALADLTKGENDYAAGLEEYQDGLSKYREGEKQLQDGRAELTDAEDEIYESEQQLSAAQEQLDAAAQELQTQQDTFDASMDALANGLNLIVFQTTGHMGTYTGADVLDGILSGDPAITALVRLAGQDPAVIAAGARQLDAAWAQITASQREITSARQSLERAKGQVKEGTDELLSSGGELSEAGSKLADARQELADARKELDDGWAEYYDGKAKLDDAKRQLADEPEASHRKLADARQELEDSEQELEDGWQEYYDSKAEADEKFADAEQELADARDELADGKQKIEDAQKKIDDLKSPSVYVLGRDANVGFVCFESDSKIVAGVAKVFPVFFFLVAALVCITTMTRMVEEQRTQIGVYKALGFGSGAIMGKYMLYSGSASLIGCVLGFFLGTRLMPAAIWQGYRMMYGFTEILYCFDPLLGADTTAAYLSISSLATFIACRSELREEPAELIRPKTQKAGQRIFLERFTFIWKRIGFLHKVSIRNIVRYRQRLFMMVIGIGGCTALLLTGYGVRDSIKNIADYQYGEISKYEYTVTFADAQTDASVREELGDSLDYLGEWKLIYESSMDIDAGAGAKSTYVVMPQDGTMEDFIDLHAESGEPVTFPGAGEAVICTNLAENLSISVGDSITLRDSDMNSLTLTVSGVCENYIYNYVYVSAESFTQQWGGLPDMKTVIAAGDGKTAVGTATAALLGCDDVSSVSSVSELRERVDNMMQSLNYIVWMIIICSGALAFIVLYNLTNINITERIREIATIKVLGFRPAESASYVFRENIILTAMGAAVGLGLGVLLHRYVMAQIRIDMMHFLPRIVPSSYLMALAFTFAFAIIVDVVMYFKLERINMAEALKSIE